MYITYTYVYYIRICILHTRMYITYAYVMYIRVRTLHTRMYTWTPASASWRDGGTKSSTTSRLLFLGTSCESTNMRVKFSASSRTRCPVCVCVCVCAGGWVWVRVWVCTLRWCDTHMSHHHTHVTSSHTYLGVYPASAQGLWCTEVARQPACPPQERWEVCCRCSRLSRSREGRSTPHAPWGASRPWPDTFQNKKKISKTRKNQGKYNTFQGSWGRPLFETILSKETHGKGKRDLLGSNRDLLEARPAHGQSGHGRTMPYSVKRDPKYRQKRPTREQKRPAWHGQTFSRRCATEFSLV